MNGNRAPYGEAVDTLVDDTDGTPRFLLEYHHGGPGGQTWYFVAVIRDGEWLYSEAMHSRPQAFQRLRGYKNEIARTT